MNEGEAVKLGTDECQKRGFTCTLKEANATGEGRWKVKFELTRGGEGKGHLHLDYDAQSRKLLDADEKFQDKAGGPDDKGKDKEDKGKGKGKGKKG